MTGRGCRTAAPALALAVVLALGAGAYPATATPAEAAVAASPAADHPATDHPATGVTPPAPPPLVTAPPPGLRPDAAAPGLRRPQACTPPPPDGSAAADTGAARMQLSAVHRLATGSGQVVAVIDTGVHPDPRFGTRLRGGGDYLTGGDGLDDCDGHGTAVAGILAAAAAPGGRAGFVGMAPDAQLVAIRQSSPSFQVPGPDGVLRPAGDVATLADAIVLAVREGARVINISEAVCLPAAQAAGQGRSIQAALRYAARADVVVVVAAGNAGVGSCAVPGREPPDQVSLPGWYGDDVLAVGAVGPDDTPASFTVPGAWVDLAAPGTGLRSLAVAGGTTGTGVVGTSFAAPWVAGLAALVRERYPDLTAAQVVDRILATARRAPGGNAVGRGVVDPVAALTAVPVLVAPDRPGAPAPTAELPVGMPVAAPDDGPVDLLAATTLLTACGATVWVLRRRPARGPREGRFPA
ncbi:type VII secretion-associated serine protease mycosin [Pseudonocardia sp. 73-21]|uniref:type VII secretion-associated serine protease mycosin n=1 Tax=Pseudonocardia sp. 73-21 TaxID=1895809 RepID=UPI00095AC74F|nr:type VII secretion-associated serine protease mycosin [Pseudonocardia sp. 73-21]OJY52588.1 MAG: type VII secretion-associated serine protease mycosin [Pseudonocardia sp. 73-21]